MSKACTDLQAGAVR